MLLTNFTNNFLDHNTSLTKLITYKNKEIAANRACFNGRSVTFSEHEIEIILKDKLLNCIFEVKLTFSSFVKIHQVNTNLNAFRPNGTAVKFDLSLASFAFKRECYFSQTIEFNPVPYNIGEKNTLTTILDMRFSQDRGVNPCGSTVGCAWYFKINNVIFPYIVYKIPHRYRLFKIESKKGQMITLISVTYLKNLPINMDIKYTYLNNYNGKVIDAI
jgi:hypothetical protein